MRRPQSKKARKEIAQAIAPKLERLYPNLKISLDWETPLQLIVATVLSAQCTDERVNQVTRLLFAQYPDAAAFAESTLLELEEAVRPTGFFRNKARHLHGLGQRLVEAYEGEVPATMEDLLTLPGVARKTANVVLSNAFGIHDGIVVDTHVRRVAHRLGLTDAKDPVKIEMDLMKILPREAWYPVPWRLILHGRAVCQARRPLCGECPIGTLCPSKGEFG